MKNKIKKKLIIINKNCISNYVQIYNEKKNTKGLINKKLIFDK